MDLYLVYALLAISIAANAVLSHKLFYKKEHILTVDAKKLLANITSSGATVRIDVLDSSQLFYRSPKG